jgi:DNA-binding response OmpR family regulator
VRRLLLVDDDPGVLDALALALGERYEVVTARDGIEALDRLDGARIDVILLDLMMPVLDGPGFVRRMRAAGHQVPLMLLTASTDAEQQARELGARDYLVKPFDVDQLEAKLAHLFDPSQGGGPVPGRGGQPRTPPGGNPAASARGTHAARAPGGADARR